MHQAPCRLRCDTGRAVFHNACMDFAPSPLARQLRERLLAYMDRYLLPYNAA